MQAVYFQSQAKIKITNQTDLACLQELWLIQKRYLVTQEEAHRMTFLRFKTNQNLQNATAL
jgi:hypothetical protein